jgi:hypothetical protein
MGLYQISNDQTCNLIKNDIGNTPGIYKLRCRRQNSEEWEHIPRLLKSDENGILYIGSSKQIMWRMGGLIKALSAAIGRNGYKDKSSHVVGHKYCLDKISQRFKHENLWIEIIPVRSEEKVMEAEELEKYENEFGEAPPFNEGRPQKKCLSILPSVVRTRAR